MGASNFLGKIDWHGLVLSPLLWGILCGTIALGLLLPGRSNRIRWPGLVMAILGIGLVLYDLPMMDLGWTEVWTFRVLTIITLVAAVATVSMKSAVYAAIWFALSLLGTAGLFFFQGAQFLAIATIIVYAGAIVVTFLFVIMLAQPEGRASYDRVSWARSSKTASVVTAALLVALLTVTVKQAKPEPLPQKRLEAVLKTDHHVARLGNYLLTQRLIEIEVAGTLLLVALVGAVAILIHAKEASAEDPDPEHG